MEAVGAWLVLLLDVSILYCTIQTDTNDIKSAAPPIDDAAEGWNVR